jgi:hypothetical protein
MKLSLLVCGSRNDVVILLLKKKGFFMLVIGGLFCRVKLFSPMDFPSPNTIKIKKILIYILMINKYICDLL